MLEVSIRYFGTPTYGSMAEYKVVYDADRDELKLYSIPSDLDEYHYKNKAQTQAMKNSKRRLKNGGILDSLFSSGKTRAIS